MARLVLILFFLINIYYLSAAQKLLTKYFITDDSVFIKWCPNDYNQFILANKKGYRIELYDVYNDKNFKRVEKRIVKTINPFTSEEWAPLSNDTFSMIAAYAMYRKNISNNYIQLYQENKQLFELAIMASDQSILAANGLGLYFSIDKSQSMYSFCKIYIHQSKDTSCIFFDNQNGKSVMSEITDYDVRLFGSNNLDITINTVDLISYYTSFDIEMSNDSIHFEKINNHPIVLQKYTTQYRVPILSTCNYIRIKPKSFFYRSTNYSTIKKICLHSCDTNRISIINYIDTSDETQLFVNGKLDTLQNISVLFSDELNFSNPIPTPITILSDSSLSYAKKTTSYYIKIKYCNKESNIYYIFYPLSSAVQDTNCTIKLRSIHRDTLVLNWDKSKNYKFVNIYYKSTTSEWITVNHTPISDTFHIWNSIPLFSDSIMFVFHFMNENYCKVYQKVIYYHINHYVKPIQSVIYSYELKQDSIVQLKYTNTSSDYCTQRLIRINNSDTTEILLSRNSYVFYDTLIHSGTYCYSIKSIDNHHNYSISTPICLYVNKLELDKKPILRAQYFLDSIRLTWKLDVPFKYIHIYTIINNRKVWLLSSSYKTDLYTYIIKEFKPTIFFCFIEDFQGLISKAYSFSYE
ncbi:MAG: hypothetical protein MUE33_02780 [Cytophagaceae bacterium]|jgi:hypothetical protein|nr:hypothetical protein [Cytophagaceae bacterium]